MNRNIIIGVIIVIILIIGGFWLFSSPSDMANPSVSTPATADQTQSQAIAPAAKTFKSIFAESGTHQCSYEQVNPASRSTSMVYIADGKMRGEFRTITATSTTVSLMIYTGGILYSWKEGAVVGKKTSINSLTDLPDVIPDDLTSGAVYGTSPDNVSWDCHDWLKDPKLLVVPANIRF